MQRPSTQRVNLAQPLTFHDPDGKPLVVQAGRLEVTRQGGRIGECILHIEVTYEVYRLIETTGLFNLTAEVRGPNFAGEFEAGGPIEIELGLSAELFEAISDLTADRIAASLIESEHDLPDLLRSENWYALNVKQAMGPVTLGYPTGWAEEGSPIYGDVPVAAQSLFSAVTGFFQSDQWPVTLIGDSTAFKTRYEGEAGVWECIAETDEQKGHFAFYSLFSKKIEPDKQPAAIEYLSRANYGLLLGNFEMDYSDGEVRFRTSLLIDDDEMLAPSTIRNLVYANLKAMDTYTGGLLTVLDGKLGPLEAIDQAEQSDQLPAQLPKGSE